MGTSDAAAIEKDAGRTLGFLRLIAVRSGASGENFYDPALGLKADAEG